MSEYVATIGTYPSLQTSRRDGRQEERYRDSRVQACPMVTRSHGIQVAPTQDRREAGMLLACAADDTLAIQLPVDLDDFTILEADDLHYRCTGTGDDAIREA